jgi:hypothetical protein
MVAEIAGQEIVWLTTVSVLAGTMKTIKGWSGL